MTFKDCPELNKLGADLSQIEMLCEKFERRKKKQDENVEAGIFRPIPVNKPAAMLLAKAPWYNKAPKGKKMSSNTETTVVATTPKKQIMGDVDVTEAMDISTGSPLYDMDKVAECFIKHIEEKFPAKKRDLARALLESGEVIDENMRTISSRMDGLQDVMSVAKKYLMSDRMTIVTECSKMTNALKDIRMFFLGKEHQEEVNRLEEFVSLCERLQKLKASGFLDDVADTMLKLSQSQA